MWIQYFTIFWRLFLNSKKIIKILKADGWVLKRIKGSHHHFMHSTKPGLVTVPHPEAELPIKTIASILRQAGLK